jgi:diguanylate cyclase (GGDEF)-like protein
MGTPLHPWLHQVFDRLRRATARPALAVGMLLAAASLAAFASPARAGAPPAWTPPELTLSRLDADPVPLQVLAGEMDGGFVPIQGAVIRESAAAPRWWRIVPGQAVDAGNHPQLVLRSPQLARVEVWTPGNPMPIHRALHGAAGDPGPSTRALVVPLPEGLAADQALYLRVQAPAAVAMPVSIEPLARVHRDELIHVAWRSAILMGLSLLAVLALGFWVGIGERSYGYLLLALSAQVAYFASNGGETRLLPGMGRLLGDDPRGTMLLGLVSALASLAFLAHYLELRRRQPGVARVLGGCATVLVVLAVATVAGLVRWVAPLAHLTAIVAAAAVFVAGSVGIAQRQRAALFVMLSWLPAMALLLVGSGAFFGLWPAPAWLVHALPGAFVLSGLVIMVGLTDTLQQMRRDRDHASRLATFDALTGALSRPAMEQKLAESVAEAHQSGTPLSVVFFDVDRFKRINDDHGHRVGDSFLKFITLRTRNRLRTYDVIGRWGGDEMVVMLPDTRLSEALGVAENLRSAINCRPLSIDGQLFDASLSLGVAELAAGETVEHLVERADSALYASKLAGRDRVTGHDPRVTGSHPRFVANSK